MSAEGMSLWGVLGAYSPGKIVRYVPLRCHFAAFWDPSQWKYYTPKTIASSCSDAKRVKMPEKPHKRGKEVLKRLVKQREGKVSKTRRILSENGRLEIFAKNRRFLTKTEGCWNHWHFKEDYIVHAAQDRDSWRRLTIIDCSSVDRWW